MRTSISNAHQSFLAGDRKFDEYFIKYNLKYVFIIIIEKNIWILVIIYLNILIVISRNSFEILNKENLYQEIYINLKKDQFINHKMIQWRIIKFDF